MFKRMIKIYCLFGVLGLGALLDRTQARSLSADLASTAQQTGLFEKQALSMVQQRLASNFDADLPKYPFATWFRQIIGPQAGVVWQLTECGERIVATSGEDIPACTEVIASLPDGRRVIVVISVGTFKKGLLGEPALFGAFLESDDRIHQIRRLRDLSMILSAPAIFPAGRFTKPVDLSSIKLPYRTAYLSPQSLNITSAPMNPAEVGKSSPPGTLSPIQKVSEGVLMGHAITKVRPVYPAIAKVVNAFGPVEVEFTISEDGRVIDAKAVRGHPTLQYAALDAARKWVFKPTLLNGRPVKVQGSLTFVFNK